MATKPVQKCHPRGPPASLSSKGQASPLWGPGSPHILPGMAEAPALTTCPSGRAQPPQPWHSETPPPSRPWGAGHTQGPKDLHWGRVRGREGPPEKGTCKLRATGSTEQGLGAGDSVKELVREAGDIEAWAERGSRQNAGGS